MMNREAKIIRRLLKWKEIQGEVNTLKISMQRSFELELTLYATIDDNTKQFGGPYVNNNW